MKDLILSILQKVNLSRDDIRTLLAMNDPECIELLGQRAEKVLLETYGSYVYFRGLIEFSNICTCNCLYCGIRRDVDAVKRYILTEEQVLDAAQFCAQAGYGSIVLQSGERQDETFVRYVENLIIKVKEQTKSDALPDGLGITLCIGEQKFETYERLFNAGAHRYLLRIETTNPILFSKIHPQEQSFQNRLDCLRMLKEIGYQVGTGVMIGLPGQSIDDLVNDILFFKDQDIDMIGMGPYIAHHKTPLATPENLNLCEISDPFTTSLKMIAITRIVCQNVNIAATTALQALDPQGREKGLMFGANIIMPQLTPKEYRGNYLLYDNKPCVDENAEDCKGCLELRIKSVGRIIGTNAWGDSKHFTPKKH